MFQAPLISYWVDIIIISLIFALSSKLIQHFTIKPKDYFYIKLRSKQINKEILFYKSKKSERWWMEVPCAATNNDKYKRHYIIACSYDDYQTALNDEIPERWWQTFQKII